MNSSGFNFTIMVISIFCLTLATNAEYSPSLHLIWNTRQIPYVIHPNLSEQYVTAVHEAFQWIHSQTCIRFIEKRNIDVDYVTIQPGNDCESYVGRKGGNQPLFLSSVCIENGDNAVGNIVHELMHVLGFYHEHQKPDRDQYVRINTGNMIDGKGINFVTKMALSSKIKNLPYDYESITHYGPTYLSKNMQPTIEALDPTKTSLMGQRSRLSLIDLAKILVYYNCETEPIPNSCSSEIPSFAQGNVRTVAGGSHQVGHKIQYECDDGYTLVGPTYRSCLLDGTWEAYPPTCMTPMHYCNFDSDDWCDWTVSYFGTGLDYLLLNSRGTPDTYTGPDDDFTTMSSTGKFAYVEASYAYSGDVAMLKSPVFQLFSEQMCFRFAYSMYGQTIGHLQVYINDGTEPLFSKSGGQGPSWQTASIMLPTDSSVQITIKMKMLGRSKGDIAIDDLLIDKCSQISQLQR